MSKGILISAALFLTSVAGSVTAHAQQPAADDRYVSKTQYEELKAAHEQLKQEFEVLRRQIQGPRSDTIPSPETQDAFTPPPSPPGAVATLQSIEDLKRELAGVRQLADASRPGTTRFLFAGSAAAGYTDSDADHSTFSAGFDPVFYVLLSDRMFFAGELEIELEDSEVEVGLEYAQIAYHLSDYATLVGGKFPNPGNYFIERLHSTWINKLPDAPLPFAGDTALQADSQVGVELRGALPISDTRLGYAVYLSNGSGIRTDEERAGTLDDANFTDGNGNKAFGGRIGWVPIPNLEIGYGFELADVGQEDLTGIDARTQAVDLSYVRSAGALKGSIDVRAQYIWVDIDNPNIEPLTFTNDSSGGYAQVAYRPTLVSRSFLRDVEGVFRYDWLDLPADAPLNVDEQRSTIGLNYWLTPSTALKAAYEFDDLDGEADNDAVLFQFATG
ncbi:MAG: hypothetical protein L6Q83_13255, partial [Gammaproteobacteria bacterium]|nr:hypothetical protein [Gammaproteobacteria bacterium]